MSNDHHHPDQLTDQIANIVKSVVASPELVNRTVGTALLHAGVSLVQASMPYLPIEANELRVQPVPIDNTGRAVLITNRQLRSENSCLVMVNWDTVENEVIFDAVAFSIDEFDLGKTKFIKFLAEVEQEVRRQVAALLIGVPHPSGSTLINVTLVNGFFKPEAAAPAAQLPAPVAEDLL